VNRGGGEGGGGPFAYYPVTGDAIREAAAVTESQAIQIRAVRLQVVGVHRQMMGAVAGDIEGPMDHAPEAATANMEQVVRTSTFAAGVMRLFADAVDQFNHTSTAPRSVDRLNAAYTEARLDCFGLDRDAYEGGRSAGRDFDSDWRDAEAARMSILTTEYARLEEQLDIWADHAARMLDRGPTPDDVRELWALGTLPPDAALLWPGLDLNKAPVLRLPYELRDEVNDQSLAELSDDELMRLWEEDGYAPARELLGDRVAFDVENMTALAELDLNMNPHYWKALSDGLSEDMARQIADANPASFMEIAAPYVIAGEFLYGITARDLVDAVRADPFSLRSLGEVAMVSPIGGVGRLTKIDNAVEAIDDLRDAERLDDVATPIKIGGPHELDPHSLRGVEAEDLRASIPKDWDVTPARRGDGVVYADPIHKGRQIRIMPGYPPGGRPDAMATGPYAVVAQNGDRVKIPLAGNPTLDSR
jgi:hypothetical protein